LLEEIRRILQENYILLPPALCKAYRLLQDKDDFADTGWEEFCLFIDAEYNFLRKKCNYPYEGNPMPWNLLSCSEKGIYMLSRLVLYFEVAIAFAAFVVMIKHYCVVFSGNGTNTALLLETLLVIVLYLLIIGIIYYHDRYLLHPFKCRLKRELNKKDIKNDDSREDELIKGCEVHNEDVGS
jgi:hypothetical protein